MKLVDILARDLKVWPFQEDALGQAKDGSLHSEPFDGSRVLEQYTRADDFATAIVTRSQWQAAVDALKAGEHSVQSIDWRKAPEGATHFDPVDCNYLRQLGTIAQCWYKSSDSWTCKGWQYPDDLSTMGRLIKRPAWSGEGLPPAGLLVENNLHGPVMVLAHGIFRGGNVVICQGDDTIITCTPDTLSPIRAAEQIAAEKRDKEIKDLYYTINWGEKPESWSHLSNQRKADYAKAIDAGYRKQVQP